jgi:hypothetical protein
LGWLRGAILGLVEAGMSKSWFFRHIDVVIYSPETLKLEVVVYDLQTARDA